MTRRRFLTALLVVLLIILAALIALFLVFRQATEAPAAIESPGFKHVRTIYGWGQNPDQLFSQPFGLAWRNDSFYVTDIGRKQVIRLTDTGNLITKYGRVDTAPDLTSPTGVDADAQGNVYTTDPQDNRIVVFDKNGAYRTAVSLDEQPLALRIDGSRMFVTTVGSLRVLAMPALNEIAKWGTQGRGTEQFDHPNGVDYTPSTGTIFVGDGNNLRVKAMNEKGDVVWIYGQPPRNMNDVGPDRRFGLVGGVTFANGYLFVADPLDCVIHILDPAGNEVAQVGDVGTVDGQFSYPTNIVWMGGNRFGIVEWGNRRLQVVDIDVPAVIQSSGQAPPTSTPSASEVTPTTAE